MRPTDPNHFGGQSNDQYGVIYSTADERWVFGGNRSGKTETLVNDCDMFCRGTHPVRSLHRKPPVKVRYVAPKWRENVKDVILGKFKEICQRHQLRGGRWKTAWSEAEHKLYYANGSTIQFKTTEEDLDTFGGADMDAIYQDEMCDYARWQENQMRLADRNGFFAAAMTPELGITWEQDHVMNPPADRRVEHWFFSSKRNPHLSKDGIAKVEASIKDPKLRAAKIEGQFVPLQGMVLPQWDSSVHVVADRPLHRNAYRMFCIDAHTRTPSAAMWAAWEPSTIEGAGPVFVVYRTMKAFMTVPEWQKEIKRVSHGEKIHLWLGDEPGAGEGKDINDQESIIRQFASGPDALPIKQVPKPPKSFEGDIYRLWDMLSPDPVTHTAQIQVFRSCDYPVEFINGKYHGSLVWEIERYQYKREQKADEETLREKVADVNDHYISDLRYLTRHDPMFGGGVAIKSALDGSW